MNSFITLVIIYGLLTIGSASILYFSFRERVDASGKYFLTSELLVLPVLSQVIATNWYPELGMKWYILFAGNAFYIASEIAIFFSIYTLTRNVDFIKFGISLFIGCGYCALIEYCRFHINPMLPILLSGISSASLAIATFYICITSTNEELKSNLFLKWISYLEIILVVFALFRMASYFSSTPIMPRQPSTAVVLLYTFFVSVNVFRYFFYLSLRISWVNPIADQANLLNKNLVKVLEDKNKLLTGLITSNRALGMSTLASSLAHQLSQPLTGINFQAEAIKRDLIKIENNQKAVSTLDKMSIELNKVTDLVKNLRKLFENQNSEFEPINLIQISEGILEIIEPTLKSNKINLVRTYHHDLVCMGDAIQIQQVLINVFNNAIDSIKSKVNTDESNSKEIRFDISQNNSFAILSIADSGSGIDPVLLQNMFELYKTTKKGGLGIGLWLSKEIMDKHQGNITAKNNPDGGAIFEICIPLAQRFSAKVHE